VVRGASPAAIAVAVIRDQLRPKMPSSVVSLDYEDLVRSCWHEDPTIRPTFLEIMTRLTSMSNDNSSGGGMQSSSYSGGSTSDLPLQHTGSSAWSLNSNTTSSASDGSHSSAKSGGAAGIRPPDGEVAFLCIPPCVSCVSCGKLIVCAVCV
jgi:hypothetical protein